MRLLLLLVLALALFSGLWAVHLSYPYYLMWDMDHQTVLDSLLLRAGRIPENLTHPGFGVNLLALLWSKICAGCAGTRLLSFDDLKLALNPLLLIASEATRLRALSPVLAFGTIVALGVALSRLTKNTGAVLLLLALFGVQGSLFYHAAMIRTELYCVFFWACAIAALTWTTRAGWITAGIFTGLCFLSKIQALFFCLSIPVFAQAISALRGFKPAAPDHQTRILGWANLGFCVLLLALAWSVDIGQVTTFATGWGVTAPAVLLVALALCSAAFAHRGRETAGIYLMCGFLLASLIHFAALAPLLGAKSSWIYLLRDWKVLFFRKSLLIATLPTRDTYLTIFRYAAMRPMLFAAFFLMPVVLVFARTPRRLLNPLLAVDFIALLAVGMGARLLLRDLIWVESILCVAIALHCLALVSLVKSSGASNLALPSLAWFLVTLALGNEIAFTLNIKSQILADTRSYGWNEDHFMEAVYGGGHLDYAKLVDRQFPKTDPALRSAAKLQARESSLTYGFELSHTGRIAENFPIEAGDSPRRIRTFPRPLVGSFFAPLDSSPSGEAGSVVPLLSRTDLRLLIFHPRGTSVPVATSCLAVHTSDQITLSDNTELVATEFPIACDVQRSSLPPGSLLVIQDRTRGASGL